MYFLWLMIKLTHIKWKLIQFFILVSHGWWSMVFLYSPLADLVSFKRMHLEIPGHQMKLRPTNSTKRVMATPVVELPSRLCHVILQKKKPTKKQGCSDCMLLLWVSVKEFKWNRTQISASLLAYFQWRSSCLLLRMRVRQIFIG